MPEIIATGGGSDSDLAENPLKLFLQKIQELGKFQKFLILTVIVFIVFAAYISKNLLRTTQNAEQPRNTLVMGISQAEGSNLNPNMTFPTAAAENAAKNDILNSVENIKNQMGRYPGSITIWQQFRGPTEFGKAINTFPTDVLQQLDQKVNPDGTGITPVIFFQTVGKGITKSENTPDIAQTYSNQAIASGSFDDFLRTWAASAAAYQKPIIFRFDHEMNGNWFPWSPYNVGGNGQNYYDMGNTPENYIQMWQHVYNLVKNIAPNVKFYWCPDSVGGRAYYPGDNYVDYVGFDIYDWNPPKGGFQSMQSLLDAPINSVRRIAPGKLIIVGETAIGNAYSVTQRSDWIANGYPTIFNNYPDVLGIIYFNIDIDNHWNLDRTMKTSYANLMSDPRFAGNFFSNTTIGETTPTITPTPTFIPTSSPTPTHAATVTFTITPTKTPTPTPINHFPIGNFDSAQDTATGWACDADDFSKQLYVQFYADQPYAAGRTPVGTTLANQAREAGVAALCGGNSHHGFVFNIPNNLKNGNHTLYAYAVNVGEGSSVLLSGSPKTISSLTPTATSTQTPAPTKTPTPTPVLACKITKAYWTGSNPTVEGISTVVKIEGTNCNGKTVQIDVKRNLPWFLDEKVAGFTAIFQGNIATAAWNTVWKNGCFLQTCDSSYFFNATVGGISIRSSDPVLTVKKYTPKYEGYFDILNCTYLIGWAADRSKLNTSIAVDMYYDGKLFTIRDANLLRPDIGKYLGDNGYHGFTMPTPLILKDGKKHTVTFYFSGTKQKLGTNDKTITCK